MACCLAGSIGMLLVAALGRALRRHLLRRPPDAPERWRLPARE